MKLSHKWGFLMMVSFRVSHKVSDQEKDLRERSSWRVKDMPQDYKHALYEGPWKVAECSKMVSKKNLEKEKRVKSH